jgi:hypothetical protein
MDLPSDLSEGWWWVRWTDGDEEPCAVEAHHGEWIAWAPGNDYPLRITPETVTALERVAPPSWERGDG